MDITINYHDEVWSFDDKKLGVATLIHHRLEGVDPAVKMYEAYLEVEDFNLGMSYYIPTEFIAEKDEESGRVYVDRRHKEILDNIWYRRPRFVANGTGRAAELPRD